MQHNFVGLALAMLFKNRHATASEMQRQRRNLYLMAVAFFVLFYPFPDNEIYGSIIELNINLKDNPTSMVTGSSVQGAAFKLKLGPREEATYRISYAQRLKSNEARYIITTTRQWGKGLEVATYRLVFPASIHLDSISILPDTMIKDGSQHHFLWDRQKFMPEVDFIFQFSQSSGND